MEETSKKNREFFKEEVNAFLQDFGGNFKPDFGFDGDMNFGGKPSGWGMFMDCITDKPKNEKT